MMLHYSKWMVTGLLLAVISMCAFASVSVAETPQSGQLLVTAVDKYNTPLPDANIVVKNTTDNSQQTMVTNSSGMALFKNITKGSYSITGEKNTATALPVDISSPGAGVQNATAKFPTLTYISTSPAATSPATPAAGTVTPTQTPATLSPTATPTPTPTPTSPGFALELAAAALALAAVGILSKKE